MPASKIETAFGKRPPCSSTNSSARARAVLSRLTLKIAFRSSATSPISLAGTWESTLRSKCTTHLCHSTPGKLPGYRRLDALMVVGDHQVHPGEAPVDEVPE